MTIDEPLIWTSKGNLPIASLEYRYQWSFTDTEVVFVEEYWLGDECVKRQPNVYLKTPVIAGSNIGGIGG